MSKITFRADDELIDALESFDASKSEVMREALRDYLSRRTDVNVDAPESEVAVNDSNASEEASESVEGAIAERIDELIERRFEAAARRRKRAQDVNVNITLDADSGSIEEADATPEETGSHTRKTGADDADEPAEESEITCGQCGENVPPDHVYCSNCGEKVTRRIFCDCGDELRSDWGFCPSCGRRTPAADVLDSA